MTTRTDMATAFRGLHAKGSVLVLPNAWDAGSARLIEECGAAAIATTSAGVAWANGYPDGNALPTAALVATVRAIARVLRVPLTVDVEGGYSDDPAAVGELATRIADAGAVGVNLEDGATAPELLCAKIDAMKRAAGDLFVNARVDVILRGLVPAADAVGEIGARIARYRAAGADGIFVPRLAAPDDIRAVVALADPLPVNVMAVPGLAPVAELRALGVRRLSAGAAVASAALGTARRVTAELLRHGRVDALFPDNVAHAAMNALLAR